MTEYYPTATVYVTVKSEQDVGIEGALVSIGRLTNTTWGTGKTGIYGVSIGPRTLVASADGYGRRVQTVTVTPPYIYVTVTLESGANDDPVPELPRPEPTPPPPPVTEPLIDFSLEGIVRWFAASWQNFGEWLDGVKNGLQNGINGVSSSLANLWSGLADAVQNIIPKASDAFAEKTTATFKSVASGSPDWEGDFTGTVDELAEIYQAQYRESMDAILNAGPVEDINIFETRAKEWAVTAFKNVDMLKKWGILAELGSLGQVEGVFNYYDWIDGLDQQSATITRIHQIELEKSLLVGYEQAMNAKYNPMIPPYQDLINMRIKEVITQEQFEEYLLKQGFSPMWSGHLWTAHFEPASWMDFLTAMRRKRPVSWVDAAGVTHSHTFGSNIPDDEQVIRELSVLVDYDDRYWDFFKERMYNDLSVREARWLLETGDIDVSVLEDIVHRHGYRPEQEELMVTMLRTFQARPWRNRYLTGLVSAYVNGIILQEELQSTIKAEGFQDEVYEYVVKIGDLRKRVQAAGGEEAVKEKILSLGDLRKLYLADKLNETEFVNRLTAQGYGYDDIVLLVSLLNDQKLVEVESKRIIELSVPELLNAWRYEEISEDTLRARLMLKGMSQGDTQILINTKRKQWEISPMGA